MSARIPYLLAAVGTAAGLCLGQKPGDELDMSVKELMQIEVSSVARKQQTLARSAAAVYVITREEIRRSGYGTVPDVLRLAPGLHVAQVGGHTWAIAARGFNGTFANKMLVLVDGRSIYTPHFGGVYWELHDLMVEDIERIEVIRGPGATMWGANAVNGVINIITRSSRSTEGGLAVVAAGNAGEGSSALRFGGRLSENVWFRVYTKLSKHRSAVVGDGRDAGDAWRDGRGGLRFDWEPSSRNAVTIIADATRGQFRETAVLPLVQAPFSREVGSRYGTSAEDLLVRWRHTHRNGTETQVQFYFDSYDRPHPVFSERRHTVDAEFQSRSRLGGIHEITWGGGYRFSRDVAGAGHINVMPNILGLDLFTAFAQDEVQLADGMVLLAAGAKVQRSDFAAVAVQPSARILVEPFRRHVFWGAVSRAVRLPSRLDWDSSIWMTTVPGTPQTRGLPMRIVLAGSDRNVAQPMIAYEAGYRTQISGRAAIDVTAFRHHYQRLRSLELGEPALQMALPPYLTMPATFADGLHGSSWGAEVLAVVKLLPRWNLIATYTETRATYSLRPGIVSSALSGEPAFQPQHLGSLRSQFDLPRGIQFDATWYGTGAVKSPATLPGLIGYKYPVAWSRLDVRGMLPIRRDLKLSVRSGGILDPHREEFRPEIFMIPTEVRRTVDIALEWRF